MYVDTCIGFYLLLIIKLTYTYSLVYLIVQYSVVLQCVYVTGSVKTVHSHTSDFKLKKLDVCEWRVFAEPVTYTAT